MQDFNKFAETKGAELRLWKIKYYKGLGTSDDVEARDYF